jgi:putative glutamine amidotransferase
MMNCFLDQRIGLMASSRTSEIEALLAQYFPSCPVQDVEQVEDLDTIDALLAGGGPDLDPVLYGAPPKYSWGVRPQRDLQVTVVLRCALNRRIPFLGLCRGAQLLNVMQGGRLYQDLAIERGCGHSPTHAVRIKPAVQQYFSRNSVINCSHHQGVRHLGRHLTVIARAHDGLPEAWWMPGAIRVQFHPETLIQGAADWQHLFRWWLSGAQLS